MNPVRAGDAARSGQEDIVFVPTPQAQLAAEIRRFLRPLHDQMAALASSLLSRADSPDQLRTQLLPQEITIKTAEAKYEDAKLSRELAELAISEYQEGIFVQDRAAAEGEVKLAQSDLERARQGIEEAKERLARIRQASRGSAGDLSLEYMYTDRLAAAQLQEQRARFAIESAEGKLKLLLDHTKPKRLKELRAAVERARSDELARHAQWELEKSKLQQLQKAIEQPGPQADQMRVLPLLGKAIPIEEQVRRKLEQLDKNGKPDLPLEKEIRDLANQLQGLVERASQEQAAARFDQWKARIQQATRRAAAPSR
jgi:hypothetical protein